MQSEAFFSCVFCSYFFEDSCKYFRKGGLDEMEDSSAVWSIACAAHEVDGQDSVSSHTL